MPDETLGRCIGLKDGKIVDCDVIKNRHTIRLRDGKRLNKIVHSSNEHTMGSEGWRREFALCRNAYDVKYFEGTGGAAEKAYREELQAKLDTKKAAEEKNAPK